MDFVLIYKALKKNVRYSLEFIDISALFFHQ